MSTPDAVLPCPFCGADPIVHQEIYKPPAHQPVECPTKDCIMSGVWPDIKAWQNRVGQREAMGTPSTEDLKRAAELLRFAMPSVHQNYTKREEMLALASRLEAGAMGTAPHSGLIAEIDECLRDAQAMAIAGFRTLTRCREALLSAQQQQKGECPVCDDSHTGPCPFICPDCGCGDMELHRDGCARKWFSAAER